MITVELRLLDPRLDGMVEYATPSAAGIDMRACSVNGTVLTDQSYSLRPGEQVMVGSGIAVYLDSLIGHEDDGSMLPLVDEHMNYAGILLPRSGLGTKFGIVLGNTTGLIDGDYQGEVKMALKNTGNDMFEIKPMDRVAQMFVVPVLRPAFKVVPAFSNASLRGEGGFGSTGKH